MGEDNDYKILVFFTTARLTQAFAEIFNLMVPSASTREFKVLWAVGHLIMWFS